MERLEFEGEVVKVEHKHFKTVPSRYFAYIKLSNPCISPDLIRLHITEDCYHQCEWALSRNSSNYLPIVSTYVKGELEIKISQSLSALG